MIPIFAIISFLGFADAFYLTVKHFQNQVPSCTLVSGCETVLTSQYATILGIPVALLGAVFYLSVLLLTVWYIDRRQEEVMRWVIRLTWLGLGASVYFVGLQLLVIQQICLYCMVSATTSTLLFLLGWRIRHQLDKTHT